MKDTHRKSVVAAISMSILFSITISACSSNQGADSPPKNIDGVLASTSEFQRDILQDKTVTQEEYEKSVSANKSCVDQAGGSTSEIMNLPNNQLGFEIEYTSSDDDSSMMDEKVRNCEEEYHFDIAQVWAFQNLLNLDERQEQTPAVADCFRQEGVDVADGVPNDQMLELIMNPVNVDAAVVCSEKFPAYFSVPGEGQ